MKRGLIAWDKTELPAQAFERRMERVRAELEPRQLPALVVYSELWRSNQGRFFSNFMPYFNRALLVLPLAHPPTLLCGLSPRVYGWIRSVTTIEDVRPAGNFAKPLGQLAAERGWSQLGVLEATRLPYDLDLALRSTSLEIVDIGGTGVFEPASDDVELSMRRFAAAMARDILAETLPTGAGKIDHHFVGDLEGKLRRAGAEDLVLLLTNGDGPPALPRGERLLENFSVSLALEYRGHWVRLSRPHTSTNMLAQCRKEFQRRLDRQEVGDLLVESLAGSYPYEVGPASPLCAFHIELKTGSQRIFYGDTVLKTISGWELL